MIRDLLHDLAAFVAVLAIVAALAVIAIASAPVPLPV